MSDKRHAKFCRCGHDQAVHLDGWGDCGSSMGVDGPPMLCACEGFEPRPAMPTVTVSDVVGRRRPRWLIATNLLAVASIGLIVCASVLDSALLRGLFACGAWWAGCLTAITISMWTDDRVGVSRIPTSPDRTLAAIKRNDGGTP